jgi:hypothetical protein
MEGDVESIGMNALQRKRALKPKVTRLPESHNGLNRQRFNKPRVRTGIHARRRLEISVDFEPLVPAAGSRPRGRPSKKQFKLYEWSVDAGQRLLNRTHIVRREHVERIGHPSVRPCSRGGSVSFGNGRPPVQARSPVTASSRTPNYAAVLAIRGS